MHNTNKKLVEIVDEGVIFRDLIENEDHTFMEIEGSDKRYPAEQAWSAFWTWDPKETWALITWILYAICMHLRLRRKLSGKVMAWFVVIAVAVVLLAFVGVNTLLPGLHSFG